MSQIISDNKSKSKAIINDVEKKFLLPEWFCTNEGGTKLVLLPSHWDGECSLRWFQRSARLHNSSWAERAQLVPDFDPWRFLGAKDLGWEKVWAFRGQARFQLVLALVGVTWSAATTRHQGSVHALWWRSFSKFHEESVI